MVEFTASPGIILQTLLNVQFCTWYKKEHNEDLNEVIEEIARQENEITLVKSICM